MNAHYVVMSTAAIYTHPERGQYRSVISRAFPTISSTMTIPIIVDDTMKEMNENRNITQRHQRHNLMIKLKIKL